MMIDLELTNAYAAYAAAIRSGDQAAIMEALRRCQAAEARHALDRMVAEMRKKLGYSASAGVIISSVTVNGLGE